MWTRGACGCRGALVKRLLAWIIASLMCAIAVDGIAAGRRDNQQQAEQLVREALAHQTLGLNDQRDRLLAEANATAPDYPPANWHQGRVRVGRDWLDVDAPCETDYQRRLRQSYERRRLETTDTVASQLDLANWCASHRLQWQETAHLHQVLQREPNHAQARARLNRLQTGGRSGPAQDFWLGLRDLQRLQASIQPWRDRLLKLAASLRDGTRNDALLDRLWAEIDVDGIAAVEVVLATHSEPAAMLAVEILSGVPLHQASHALARIAVLSPWAEVRNQAAVQLRPQPQDHYVPLLLSGLSSPIESRVDAALIGGQILYRHQFAREVQDQRQITTLDTMMIRRPSLVQTADGNVGMVDPLVAQQTVALAAAATRTRALTDMQQQLFLREQLRMQHNRWIESMNQRIGHVLSTATGESLTLSPQEWWAWWDEVNGVSMDGEKFTSLRYEGDVQVYQDSEPLVARGSRSDIGTSRLPRRADCFVAGTPVWTISGLQPIEEIRTGDLVLSQDVQTGELAYRPVLQTSTRPAEPLIRVTLANRSREEFQGSGGHPLWVAGDGWQRLRQLQSGAILHALGGSVLVSDVQPSEAAETYNLVVADFHTYVVGHAKIICHDNTPRQPTNAVIPGLIPR
jgi:hypothetical protein